MKDLIFFITLKVLKALVRLLSCPCLNCNKLRLQQHLCKQLKKKKVEKEIEEY